MIQEIRPTQEHELLEVIQGHDVVLGLPVAVAHEVQGGGVVVKKRKKNPVDNFLLN